MNNLVAHPPTTNQSSSPNGLAGVNSQIVDMTPDMAREIMEQDALVHQNRRLRTHHVHFLEHVIAAGQWELNNDAITFDAQGRLSNGQHRLIAIANGIITVKVLVLQGVTPDAQRTMDSGMRRRTSDNLELAGFTSSVALAAIGRMIFYYNANTGTYTRQPKASDDDILNLILADDSIQETLRLSNVLRSASLKPKAAHSVGIWAALNAWPAQLYLFIDSLATGVNLFPGSSALKLRNAMMSGAFTKMEDRQTTALFLKGFNRFIDNEPMNILTWKTNDKYPFPWTPESYALRQSSARRGLKGWEKRREAALVGADGRTV